MPAVSKPNSKIVVTGANGFIATYIVGDLLKKGYIVHATVRAREKADNILELYKNYGANLRIFEVPDMMIDGAFDEALKDVDGILHTAAEAHIHADDPKEMIEPAIQGVTGLLKSAQKQKSVKRVVITSSCATVMGPGYATTPVYLSESFDFTVPVEECEAKGREASGFAKYSASKILAEKAAFEFVEKNKAEIAYDIVVLNIPFIFGPAIQGVKSVEGLNGSNLLWYYAIVKSAFSNNTSDPLLGSPLNCPGQEWMDVRDCSLGHILALETPAASGRIIISAGPVVWQDFLEVTQSLASCYPNPLPKPAPGEKEHLITFDSSKAQKLFGIKYRPMEETARDILLDFAQKGW